MPWLEVHNTFPTHRKTLRAASLLRIKRQVLMGHLLTVWLWALENADGEGRLGQLSDTELAEVAEWDVEDGKRLRDALIESGFLEVVEHGELAIHNWPRYTDKLTALRAAGAARKRRSREKQREAAEGDQAARSRDKSQANGRMSRATGPNRTGPDQTEPDAPPLTPLSGGAKYKLFAFTEAIPGVGELRKRRQLGLLEQYLAEGHELKLENGRADAESQAELLAWWAANGHIPAQASS